MRYSLLLSTALMIPVASQALAADFSMYTHTNTPIELVSISPLSNQGIKLASICFLGVGDCDPNIGYGKGDDYSSDTIAQCLNEGFILNNCSSVQSPEAYCPYNKSYITKCKCVSGLISCPAGQVGVGASCNGKYASCKCDPALVSCASNQNGVGAYCGGRYQSCACKSEYQYTSSNCTSPRSVNGSSCGGKYTGCVCPSGVSGSYGCESYYASPCSSVCKKAYSDNCRNKTAVSVPANGTCSGYYSDCSSKCSSWSCNSGYRQSGSSCAKIDPCENRTNASCTYGCASYWSDCSSKCQSCKGNPCDSVTAVSVPSNASCSAYHSSCSSKCSSWKCNSGYNQSGSSCVLANPCPGYYECGGTWQYCTGTKCSADSTKCSVYCSSDYFTNQCDSASNCKGIYRNGYCSGSCTPSIGGGFDNCPGGMKGSHCYCTGSAHSRYQPGHVCMQQM